MSWLELLPQVYREQAAEDPGFLEAYLRGFERVLSGSGDPKHPGIEELLDGIEEAGVPVVPGIERYFQPETAPHDALPWLAEWVAVELWGADEAQHRGLIANAVSLYGRRGTKEGLEATLRLYGVGATITEDAQELQIGVHSTLGVDTRIGGGAPFAFRVHAYVPSPSPAELDAATTLIRAVLDSGKPAYTTYTLTVDAPSLQIGVRSTVGVDTMIDDRKRETP